MPRMEHQPDPALKQALGSTVNGGQTACEVLTLAETAAYLRLAEVAVLKLVTEQGLPTRRVGKEWRFLKAAVQQWLGMPLQKGQSQGIWGTAGALRGDPYLDQMLQMIDRMRGGQWAD